VVHEAERELKSLCLASNAGLFYAGVELKACIDLCCPTTPLRAALSVTGGPFFRRARRDEAQGPTGGRDDAEAICRSTTKASRTGWPRFETELRTPGERRQWLAARGPRQPRDPSPRRGRRRPGLGSPQRLQCGATRIRFVADFSVYVERGARGQGVGRAMLERLIELGREHGYHKLVLSALSHQRPGWRFTNGSGFRTVGVYEEQGQLDGRGSTRSRWRKLLDR